MVNCPVSCGVTPVNERSWYPSSIVQFLNTYHILISSLITLFLYYCISIFHEHGHCIVI